MSKYNVKHLEYVSMSAIIKYILAYLYLKTEL